MQPLDNADAERNSVFMILREVTGGNLRTLTLAHHPFEIHLHDLLEE